MPAGLVLFAVGLSEEEIRRARNGSWILSCMLPGEMGVEEGTVGAFETVQDITEVGMQLVAATWYYPWIEMAQWDSFDQCY